MHTKNIKSTPYYFFNKLDQFPGLLHFVSTRHGGISEGSHSSLNLSLRVNDNPVNVYRNREIVAEYLGIETKNLIFSSQTHEDKVAVIDKAFMEKPDEEQNIFLQGTDAMVTNLKDVCLCILTADCASIILYDPVVHAIGIAHAGWKGTILRIAAKTLECMKDKYNTNPENAIAAIGPCISVESFEVGTEVAHIFSNTFKSSTRIVLQKPEWHKNHVDLVEANIDVLKSLGIKEENIETSGICTYQNPAIFFSARKHAEGRFASGIMLKRELP